MQKHTPVTFEADSVWPLSWVNIIWPETLRARKVVRRSNYRRTGKYPCHTMGRMVEYESLIERDALMIFDADPRITSISEQPAKLEFMFKGKVTTHYPDFLIEGVSMPPTLVETKDDKQAATPEIQARTHHLASVLPRYGYEYQLLTSAQVREQPRLDNSAFVLRYGWTHGAVDVGTREATRRKLIEEELTWQAIEDGALGVYGISLVCRLILDGYLEVDFSALWLREQVVVQGR